MLAMFLVGFDKSETRRLVSGNQCLLTITFQFANYIVNLESIDISNKMSTCHVEGVDQQPAGEESQQAVLKAQPLQASHHSRLQKFTMSSLGAGNTRLITDTYVMFN